MGIRDRYDRQRKPKGRRNLDQWGKDWCRAAGLGLVLGFLMPIVWRGGRMAIFTTIVGRRKGWSAVAETLPLLLGVCALIACRSLKGHALGALLFWTALFVLAFPVVFDEPAFPWMMELERGAGWPLLLILAAVAAIAGANHMMKESPRIGATRILPAMAGIVVLAAVSIPFTESGSILSGLLNSELWKEYWPTGIIAAGLVIYGILGVAAAARGAGAVNRALSRYLRALAVGVLLLAVVQIVLAGGRQLGDHGGPVLLIVKLGLLFYGELILLGVGVGLSLGPRPRRVTLRRRIREQPGEGE